jgi:hypothetical protein
MAFPSGWLRKHKITIDSSLVAETLANFPVLLVDANFLDDCYDNAQSAGQDIRFTSDESGTTELPFEIVAWSQSGKTSEVWVKVTSISHTTDTDIWVWYGNGIAAAYAKNATYGRFNVWTDYVFVCHGGDVAGDATKIFDSGPNELTINKNGAQPPTETTGKVKTAQIFDGNDWASMNSGGATQFGATDDFTISCWIQHTGAQVTTYAMSSRTAAEGDIYFMGARGVANTPFYQWFGTLAGNNVVVDTDTIFLSDAAWHYCAGIRNTADDKIYVFIDTLYDGDDADPTVAYSTTSPIFYFGSDRGVANFFIGSLDEMRLYEGVRSENWLKAEYNNMNSPSTFSAASGLQTSSTSSTLHAPIGMLPHRQNQLPKFKGDSFIDSFLTGDYGNDWTVRTGNASDISFSKDMDIAATANLGLSSPLRAFNCEIVATGKMISNGDDLGIMVRAVAAMTDFIYIKAAYSSTNHEITISVVKTVSSASTTVISGVRIFGTSMDNDELFITARVIGNKLMVMFYKHAGGANQRIRVFEYTITDSELLDTTTAFYNGIFALNGDACHWRHYEVKSL